MIGQTISHYRIIRKLGAGGMGVVYLATDNKLDRPVALKFLPPESARDPVAKVRFIREAQAAALLSHPNIATIYEVDEVDDLPFIAMEYIEGKTLKEKIEAGPMKLAQVRSLGEQIALGLQEAHDSGIVHRDVKPANIMLTTKGAVKILDFGLALSLMATKLTKPGTTVGTISYLSPEQAKDDPVDHRTDIWALGVILYEMITGRPPFRADHDQGIIFAIMNKEAEPVTRIRTGVPQDFERLVDKSLAKDPGDRYQHVSELAVDLRRASETGSHTQGTIGHRPGIPRRYLGLVAGLLIVVLALLGVSLWSDRGADSGGGADNRVMIAVLPFENLGDPSDAYFADGITDEILTKLSSVAELGVIARESSFQYRGVDLSIPEIGKRLGVDYILQGTIRWQRISESRSSVRITPKLVSVDQNTTIWADAYQEDLEQIFLVQASIGEKVIESLNIALFGRSKDVFQERPTASLQAYNFYLRSMELSNNPGSVGGNLQQAEEMLEKAVGLDPEFSLAHAELSITHGLIFNNSLDRSEERLQKAKESLDTAISLTPDLPEVHVAAGQYAYFSSRDYETALEAFEKARALRPNDWNILFFLGVIHKRQGLFQEGVEFFRLAQVLNPTNFGIAQELGVCHYWSRQFEEAEAIFRQSVSMWPDRAAAHGYLADVLMLWDGDSKRAREVLEAAKGIDPRDYNVSSAWFMINKLEGKYEEGLNPLVGYHDDYYRLRRELENAELFHYLGRQEDRDATANAARMALEQKIQADPGEHRWHGQLGVAYALLGRKEDAIREGTSAMDLMPVQRDALDGTNYLESLAWIYVLVGEHELALDKLEYLLSIPSRVTKPLLRVDPMWAPLRENPRFLQLTQ